MNTQRCWNRRGVLFAILWAVLLVVWAGPLCAELRVEAAMGDQAILAGQGQTGYLRVALTGNPPAQVEKTQQRAPVNLALVLDRSGSMQGEKIQRVKEAARQALERLRPEDIVSLVVYNETVSVLVPATKLADGAAFRAAIDGISAHGKTALHAGVLQGAAEVRKFLGEEYVNRIILLSDGLANVGPDTPEELEACGECLLKEGISVSTIGVGLDYNEELMTRLAAKSDGNHLFAERPEDILKAFSDEFEDATTVVAKNVGITIAFDPRVHPRRALGREVTTNGQAVYAGLNQLYSGQTKYVLLEVAIDPITACDYVPSAKVQVEYADPFSGSVKTLYSEARFRVTDSVQLAMQGENRDVMECVAAQLAVERNERAVQLRDQGQVAQSQQMLRENAEQLEQQAQTYKSESLEKLGKDNRSQASEVADDSKWKALRKSMSKGQFDVKRQTGK